MCDFGTLAFSHNFGSLRRRFGKNGGCIRNIMDKNQYLAKDARPSGGYPYLRA